MSKESKIVSDMAELFWQRLENKTNIDEINAIARRMLLNMSSANNSINTLNSVREAFANEKGSNVINDLIIEINERPENQK